MTSRSNREACFAGAAKLRIGLSAGGFLVYPPPSRPPRTEKNQSPDAPTLPRHARQPFPERTPRRCRAMKGRASTEQTPVCVENRSGLAPRTRAGGPGARESIQARGSRRARRARSLALASPHAGPRSQREKGLYAALKNARQGTQTKTKTGQHAAV